jgi:hypothetical protein
MPVYQERDRYLRECAARFARDLEQVLKRDPLQWYNFYPFWEPAKPRPRSVFAAPAAGLAGQTTPTRQVSRRPA